MKGYLIDPTIKTIAPVEYDGDYKSIYGLIDAQTFDVIRLDHNDALYIDDEGLLKDDPGPFFTLNGDHVITVAGKGLVLGTDEEGETVAAKSTIEELTALVAFPDLRFTGMTTSEGETDHPVFGKAFVIRNEAHFEPVAKEATHAHDSGEDR